jgi:hypothetical protein
VIDILGLHQCTPLQAHPDSSLLRLLAIGAGVTSQLVLFTHLFSIVDFGFVYFDSGLGFGFKVTFGAFICQIIDRKQNLLVI